MKSWGEILFEYELLSFSFFLGMFLYAISYAWPNVVGSLFDGLHAVGLTELILVVIWIRIKLPHTLKGGLYAITAGLFCPLSGETIFMPFYWYWLSRFNSNLPQVGGLWMVGQLGFLALWMLMFFTGTRRLFKVKWLLAGVAALLPVMFFWKYEFNFFLWNYAANPFQLFIGDLFTVVYYTIWCAFLAVAFNPEGISKL